MKRAQTEQIKADLLKKMVILVGPRQAGKTYLAMNIAKSYDRSVYLNYDSLPDREIMKARSWLDTTDLLILDELHKMSGWKNYLKGVYDTKPAHMHLLVTGSVRLDVYSQVGDSLAGRYFAYHLLPLSLAELKKIVEPIDFERLITRGGFPEPYLSTDPVDAERWRLHYATSLIRTDVLDFEKIADVKAMQTVFDLLRHRVGSPVSYNSIARDVDISPTTVKKYIEALEALYIVFRISSYSKNIARSLLKEPKIYFFDTGMVQGDEGIKLENTVAVSLLKHCYAKRDLEAKPYQLNYIRTKDGKEVDFALVYKGEIECGIEVKQADTKPSKTLTSFCKRYEFPGIQLVKHIHREYQTQTIKILKAQSFLEDLLQ